MRSIKLLVAMAAIAALVGGPVLAQDAMSGSAPATETAKPVKHHMKKHAGKKHHKKTSAAPVETAPAQ